LYLGKRGGRWHQIHGVSDDSRSTNKGMWCDEPPERGDDVRSGGVLQPDLVRALSEAELQGAGL
jgi:hypothetical protein